MNGNLSWTFYEAVNIEAALNYFNTLILHQGFD